MSEPGNSIDKSAWMLLVMQICHVVTFTMTIYRYWFVIAPKVWSPTVILGLLVLLLMVLLPYWRAKRGILEKQQRHLDLYVFHYAIGVVFYYVGLVFVARCSVDLFLSSLMALKPESSNVVVITTKNEMLEHLASLLLLAVPVVLAWMPVRYVLGKAPAQKNETTEEENTSGPFSFQWC